MNVDITLHLVIRAGDKEEELQLAIRAMNTLVDYAQQFIVQLHASAAKNFRNL